MNPSTEDMKSSVRSAMDTDPSMLPFAVLMLAARRRNPAASRALINPPRINSDADLDALQIGLERILNQAATH